MKKTKIDIPENKSIKKTHWIRLFFICYFIFLIGYCAYLFIFMDVRITLNKDVQKNYGQYLVDMQDKIVEHSLIFDKLVEDTERVYTDEEKESIKQELLDQNDLLKKLQATVPDETNEDYALVYKDILKIFGLYIQGETMQAEYIYGYKDSYIADEINSDKTVRMETYTMGTALCNMMGNMMLNNYTYINDVRNTTFESKYTITPVNDLENYISKDASTHTVEEQRQKLEEIDSSDKIIADTNITQNIEETCSEENERCTK